VLQNSLLWSPAVFAALAGLAIVLVWNALRPAPQRTDVVERLDEYLDRGDIVMDEALSQPFVNRAIAPAARGVLRSLGRLLPQQNAERTRAQLEQAGNPYGLTVLDYYGVRLLVFLAVVVGAYLLTARSQGFWISVRNAALAGVFGFILPVYWLRSRVRNRKHDIQRALPDALDMLTIGVEAGLAFESAMVRVGEQWKNALTREFRRAVGEMRVGMTREEALERMAERCDVPDLTTFVAVLVQSGQMGVSIADVLHAQAEAMRIRRRQRAEELARQAGIKMLIPLVFFIFPALMIAILGPAVPGFIELWQSISGP
jgi:tight adherence protein C